VGVVNQQGGHGTVSKINGFPMSGPNPADL